MVNKIKELERQVCEVRALIRKARDLAPGLAEARLDEAEDVLDEMEDSLEDLRFDIEGVVRVLGGVV